MATLFIAVWGDASQTLIGGAVPQPSLGPGTQIDPTIFDTSARNADEFWPIAELPHGLRRAVCHVEEVCGLSLGDQLVPVARV